MLRDLDLNRQNCNFPEDHDINKIPLTNEHGDQFLRHNEYDDCGPISAENGGYEDFPPNQQYYNNQRPSPVESDYFYDQYVDSPDTLNHALNNTLGRINQTSPFVDFNNNKFNHNQYPPLRPPPSSQFTFFGHPLPSITLGNIWGQGRTANNRAASGENGNRGKGRVQIFRQGDPELEVIVNRPTNDLDFDTKNREPAASVKKPVVDSVEKIDEKFYRPYPYFQTPFSQPKPEKGFSPMIPGMVAGFIPIHDPETNKTMDVPKNNDWPRDDHFKEVPLVTKSESQSKRTSSVSASIGQIDKIGSTTVSHLATSISPILSTLVPKVELVTEKSNVDEPVEQEEEIDESVESRNPNKLKFEDEIYRQYKEVTATHPPNVYSSSTTENVLIENRNENYQPRSSTTESVRDSIETVDDVIDNFNGSSSLSADHLIAPGSIIPHSQEIPNKAITLPGKAGKITKVFSPAPPAATNNNEISKLLSPFFPQQHSSEPPTSFDNEYQQTNQIYQQTFNENERISEAPQYDRNDMEWYFNSYNQSQSNPILNYNVNPYDNYERSSANSLKLNFLRSAIIFVVIKMNLV
jgi:hypothetical protein